MGRKAKADEPKRKIGERTETIHVKLTPMQIEDERATVIDLIQTKEELEERLKSSKADYKAKIAEVDSKTAAALGAIRSGKTSREVVIEEWLTDRNEVVRLDKATGLEIGERRTATARELQEELPLPAPNRLEATVENDGEAEHEREIAEDQKAEGDDGDFGDKA